MNSISFWTVSLSLALACLFSLGCSEDSDTSGGLLDVEVSSDVDDGNDVVLPTSDGLIFPDTEIGGEKDGEEGTLDAGEDDVSDPLEDIAAPEDIVAPEDIAEVEDVEDPIEDVQDPEEDVVACVDEPPFPSLQAPVLVDGPADGLSDPVVVWNGMDLALFWYKNDNGGTPTAYFARMDLDGSFTVELQTLWTGAGLQRVEWTGSEYVAFYGVWDESNPTLWLQRVSEDGALVGAPVLLATASEGVGAGIYISGLGYSEDVFTVFWFENTGYSPTYHQRFTTDGGALSPPTDFAPELVAMIQYSVPDVGDLVSIKDAALSPLGMASIVRAESPTAGPGHWLVLHADSGEATNLFPIPIDTPLDYLQHAELVWNGTGFGVIQAGQPTNEADGNFEVYFSLVDMTEGASSSIALSGGTGVFPQMVFTGEEYGIVWQGAGMEGILFARIGADGTPDQELGVVVAGDQEEAGDMLPFIIWVNDRYVVSWSAWGGAYNSYVVFSNPICAE